MKQVFLLLSLFLSFSSFVFAQGDCVEYAPGTTERKACEYCSRAIEFRQGARESQQLFDSAIAACPTYAWAYMEKSVPYFKRGLPHLGLPLLNKAVELEPRNYLCYRASWFYEYQSYSNAIRDLEIYYAMPQAGIQFTPSGDLNMEVVLGLCYARKGDYKKAIEIINRCIVKHPRESERAMLDFHALGVVKFLNGDNEDAIEILKRQLLHNQYVPDAYYYLGLAYREAGDEEKARSFLSEAEELLKTPGMKISFCYPVCLTDVQRALRKK